MPHADTTQEKPSAAPRHHVGIFDAFQLFKYRIMWVCGAIQFMRLGIVTGFKLPQP